MKKIKNYLCKYFGHSWILYKKDSVFFRVCKRCNVLEEYRINVPVFGSGWYRLVQYTTKYGNEILKRLK